MSKIAYTDLEREVIVLKAVTEMIDEMMNYEMFERIKSVRDVQLSFCSMTHQRLFNVLLVDLLSKPVRDDFGLPKFPIDAQGSAGTFLYYLRLISENPSLYDNDDAPSAALADPVEAFTNWLDAECRVERVWFSSINIETTILIPRIEYIKLCGDFAKHSFPRMSINADRLRKISQKTIIRSALNKHIWPCRIFIVVFMTTYFYITAVRLVSSSTKSDGVSMII